MFFQTLVHDSKKRTAHNKFTPVVEQLTTSFPTLNTTNRPFICWHTASGHSWKQDVLLLLFKLNRFKSGSQLNFKNRCYTAKGLSWPQQREAILLELEYSLLAGRAIKDALNWKQEQPTVYSWLHSVTAQWAWVAAGHPGLWVWGGSRWGLVTGSIRCLVLEGLVRKDDPPPTCQPPVSL